MTADHATEADALDWGADYDARLAAMTPAERAKYDAAAAEADLALDLAQMVYDARIAAGLSQAELAKRMGTSQATVSLIEGGGQVPTVATLAKVARATGQALHINLPAA